MHKKHNKHSKREPPQKTSSSKKVYVKSKKETECSSALEIKVPQNSKCEVNRGYGDADNKENRKLKHKHKEKHKHRKHDDVKHEASNKDEKPYSKKQEKHSKSPNKREHVEALESSHLPKHRKSESKEKHEDKLRKPEKHREESIKTSNNKPRHRSGSFSLQSSDNIVQRKEKHTRREKTFHMEDLKKTRHSKIQIKSEQKEMKTSARRESKEKVERKHKHKELIIKDAGMSENQIMYCQIDQLPIKKTKVKHVDSSNPNEASKSRKEKPINVKKSTSKDATFCGEGTAHPTKEKSSRTETHYLRSKEKKRAEAIKYSPRKAKMKEYSKTTRDQRSTISLGPYNQYFVFEKKSELENSKRDHQERKRHRRNKEDREKTHKENDANEDVKESRRRSKQQPEEKVSEKGEDLREKIEDDLKSYFTKIQSLIDKKLEHILHSNSREDKHFTRDDIPQRENQISPERNDEKRNHRSHSRKEKRTDKYIENEDHKSRGHKSRALEKQSKEVKNVDSEIKHKSNRTARRSDNKSPNQMVGAVENEEHRLHQRQRSPKLANFENISSEQLIIMKHVAKTAEEAEHRHKSGHRSSRSPQIPQRDISPNKRMEEMYARNPNDALEAEEGHQKKSKRREGRVMNLECKTVSIIGIPSQIKESVLSQAQTSTSLNNVVEDTIEKKKQSKRFKLYYKYSVADNTCPRSGSDNSSDRKSVVSDSYKVMSDNSEERRLDKLDVGDKEEEPTKDPGKVIFVMKREHCTKSVYGDNFKELDQRSKKHRKQQDIPKLNNIVEESSNVSLHGKTIRAANDVNCKYFNNLNTSSSDCNLQMSKKPTLSDWNIHSDKYKRLPLPKYNLKKIAPVAKPRPERVSPERDSNVGHNKPEKRGNLGEKRMENKPKVEVDKGNNSKFHKVHREFGKKFGSKSDIDISYDSLHTAKNKKPTGETGNRAPEPRTEPLRTSRDRHGPKNISQKSPREKSNTRKPIKKFTDELPEFRNVDNELHDHDDKRPRNEAASGTKKNDFREVTRIPSSISRRYVEKELSRLQVPDVSSTQNVNRGQNPEKVVRNCSCQSNFKDMIDVGIGVQMNEDGSNVLDELSPTVVEKKPFPKTAEVAVEAKVIRKRFPIYRKERYPKTAQKLLPKTNEVAIEANIPIIPQTDKEIGKLEKKHLSLNRYPLRSVSPKTRRPISQLYTRQKSDLVRVKQYPDDNKLNPKHTAADQGTRERSQSLCKTCPVNSQTVLDSNKLQKGEKPPRSASCSEKSRRDDNSLWGSKSALNIHEIVIKHKESDKDSSGFFVDNSNPLKSSSQFMEHSAIKSIISDNPHASRLFLTKNFSREGNSYQRRKIYDEGIRQRMRKKIQDKLPSQVFEVRYLTFEQDSANGKSNASNDMGFKPNRCKMPTFSCNSKTSKNGCRRKSNSFKLTPKKSLKSLNKKQTAKESASKLKLRSSSISSRHRFRAGIVNDVDQLTRSKRNKFQDNSVEEIFVKGGQLNDQSLSNMFSYCKQLADIQSSSLLIKDSGTSAGNRLSSSNSEFKLNNGNDNFMNLVDCLCKSIVTYCNSKLRFPGEENSQDAPEKKRLNAGKESGDNNLIDSESHEDTFVPANVGEGTSSNIPPEGQLLTPPIKVRSSDQPKENRGNIADIESPRSVMSSHASCPALAMTPSSFEFLYEEESEYSKETILANLSKPVDTILAYALHDNSSVIDTATLTTFEKKIDQISNSPTDSGESGYSSHSSKRFSSLTNFFKKPSIAALFKPLPDPLDRVHKMSLVEGSRSATDFAFMTKQCHEYAQKVRLQCESKTTIEEQFQEISLDILLGRSNESFNSNCSLCKELSKSGPDVHHRLVPCPSYISIEEIKSEESLMQSENELETLIYYENHSRQPSLEIIKAKRIQPKRSTIDICSSSSSQGIIDCEIVLSSTNLNRCSLTLIETERKGGGDYIEGELHNYEKLTERSKKKYNVLRSTLHNCQSNLSNIMSSTLIIENNEDKSKPLLTKSEINIALDKSVSANWLPSLVRIHDSSEIKKTLAKKFFENLIQVYDRELNLTTKLFEDDYFLGDLLIALEDTMKVRSRGKQKFKDIKGKLKDCIEKVFCPKAGDNDVQEEDVVEVLGDSFEKTHQENLKLLAFNARRYFSLFVQAVRVNKDINNEIKIFGLLKILERIENGDFAILRKEEDVNFEDEIRDQVKEGFLNIYKVSMKEAKKCKRSLTQNDLELIRAFVCKYRIGLLSKTDLIATYIGRGLFKTESQLRAAVTYLIRSQTTDIDLKDFEEYCDVYRNCKNQ